MCVQQVSPTNRPDSQQPIHLVCEGVGSTHPVYVATTRPAVVACHLFPSECGRADDLIVYNNPKSMKSQTNDTTMAASGRDDQSVAVSSDDKDEQREDKDHLDGLVDVADERVVAGLDHDP